MAERDENLYRLKRKDVARAVAVLRDAFRDDPLWNAVFAGEPDAGRKLQAFFEVPVLLGLRYGEAVAPTEAIEGVAVWLPGEHADMTMGRMIASGALRPGLRLGMRMGSRLGRIFPESVRDRREHMTGTPYLYLQVIGVATEHQGRGLGGMMLRSLIETSERQGLALYLETETETNVRMYEKFGFRTVKTAFLPVVGLPFWEMVRAPRG